MRIHEAHALVDEWAGSELAEIRQVWYAATAPGFSDHVAGYRSNFAVGSREARISATGKTLYLLSDAHRTLLLRHYRASERVSRHALRLALQAFCQMWDAEAGPVDNSVDNFHLPVDNSVDNFHLPVDNSVDKY